MTNEQLIERCVNAVHKLAEARRAVQQLVEFDSERLSELCTDFCAEITVEELQTMEADLAECICELNGELEDGDDDEWDEGEDEDE